MTVDKRMLARSSPAGLAWWNGGAKYTDKRDGWQWLPAPHLLLLSEKLVDVATGRTPRLIVTMPPRHGKSELISKYGPAWFLGAFPDKKVMLASYADTFAAQWGRKSRDVLKEEADLFGVKINPETSGGQYWELVGRNGVMVTAGVGGGLTGKGAHFLIIDDPVKNSDEAASDIIREKHWDWWKSSVRTRLQKGGGVILVMTRWHEDDLAGRMLANDPRRDKHGKLLPEDAPDREGVEGDHWEVLNLPAFAEPDDYDAVDNPDAVDAVGRKHGEVLWDEMFDADWMDQTRKAQGSYWFSAMYQQRPAPADGLLFKKANFRYYEKHFTGETWLVTIHKDDTDPVLFDIAYGRKFQTVDVAASEKQQSDYTVVSTWIVTPEGDLLWWDMEAQQFDTTKVGSFVKRKFFEHMPAVCKIERLGHGLNVIQQLLNDGLPIGRLEPDTDKVSRALPICARYEEHRVYHPMNATWKDDAELQLLGFPNSKNDDIVDTVSYAGIELPFFMGGGGGFRSSTTSQGRRGSTEDAAEVVARTAPSGRRGTITRGILRGEF